MKLNSADFCPYVDKEDLQDYTQKLEKDGTWGGQLEITALSKQFKFNAIVHQVGNPDLMIFNHKPPGSVPTIHISYHLGRHYNSIRRQDDDLDVGQAPVIYCPIGHDLV